MVASEGLKDKNGEIYSASSEKDSFGHSQLGGLAPKIANLVSSNLNLKYHWSVSDYLQRSARHLASKTDLEQAVAVGKRAVEFALSEKSGIMPVIQRVSEDPYQWSIGEGDLKDIANEEKVLPNDYISDLSLIHI